MTRLLLCATVLVASGCHRDAEAVIPSHVSVVRTIAIRQQSDRALERRGEVAPAARLHLGFRAPGTVRAVYVREGDAVRKGQLLAMLDDTDASASLRDAEASAKDAQAESDSARALVASGSIPQRSYDRATTELDRALARRALAAQSVVDTHLYAPISGQVLSRHVEPGEVVEPASTLFVIDESHRLSVRIGLAQRDVARVHVEQDVTLAPVGESPSPPLAGYVASVTPAPNPDDALYTVEVRPKDGTAWAGVRPGSQVTVRFADASPPAVVRVGLDALVHRRDQDIVFVVEGRSGETTVRARVVTLGWSEGSDVVLEGGLQEGDRIVSEGAYFLKDGDRVAVVDRGDT
jgi:RND family efflux transporter MFP subunit